MDDIHIDTFAIDAETIKTPNVSYSHQLSPQDYEKMYSESIYNGNEFWEKVCALVHKEFTLSYPCILDGTRMH